MANKTWYVLTPGYVETSSGTNGETLIKFNLEATNFDNTYFPFRFPDVPQYKRAVLDLAPFKSELKQSDCLSLEVYPEVPDRAAVWLDAGAINGKWTAAIWPLKPRQWNRIYLGLSNLTPEERGKLKSLMIGNTAIGLLPGDSKWQTYRIRNLTFGKLPVRTETGWQTAGISVSRVGFPMDAPCKQAVLPLALAGKAFKVISSRNNTTAFAGTVEQLKSVIGDFAIADFSALCAAGHYRLEVDGGKSVSFEIGDNPYKEASALGMGFFRNMRSGTATKAHPLCFIDDALREDTKKRVDVSGGWFDASDVRGYFSMAMTNVMRMFCLAAEATGDHGIMRDEAAWGARHHQKLWCEDNGLPYTGLALYPGPEKMKILGRNFFKANNYWTDNKVGTADDRTVHTPWNSRLCHLDLFSFNAGMVAAGAHYAVLSKDEFTEACKLNSERHFQLLQDVELLKKSNTVPDIRTYDDTGNLSLMLESSIALGRSTGQKKYFDIAETIVAKLLQRQVLDYWNTMVGPLGGWLRSSSAADNRFFFQTLAQEMPFTALLQTAENHPLLSDAAFLEIMLRAGIYSDMYLKPRRRLTAPYHLSFNLLAAGSGKTGLVIGHRQSDNMPIRAVWTNMFTAGFAGAQSFEIYMLAKVLRDPLLAAISEEILRWQFGENPFSVNMMAGIGDDEKGDIMSSVLGYMPGMMSNCEIKNGSVPGLPHFRHYAHNEIYTQAQGPFQAVLFMHTAPVEVYGEMKHPRQLKAVHSDGKTSVDFMPEADGGFKLQLPKPGCWTLMNGQTQSGRITAFRGITKINGLDGNGSLELTSLDMPHKLKPDERIKLKLSINNFSGNPQTLSLQNYAVNLKTEKKWTGVLQPGMNTVTLFATVLNQPGKIAGIIIAPENDRGNNIYAVGVIERIDNNVD